MDKYIKRQLVLYDIGNISDDNDLLKHYSTFKSVIGNNIEYHYINDNTYYYTSSKGYILYVSKYRNTCFSYIHDELFEYYKKELSNKGILSTDSVEYYLYIFVSHIFNGYKSGCIYSTQESDLKIKISGSSNKKIY